MKRILYALLLSLCFLGLMAQDGHYWTQQYGTRSMLLSGSVIGGVEDLGAVYYNPGRLSQIENPAFLISADVYEFNRLKINDAFGNNQSASQQDIKGVPSLAAGTFKIPFLKNHSFAWAILVRGSSNLSFSYSDEIYDDVLEEFPGKEDFGGETSVSQKVLDQWTGFTWSYSITERLSLGVSGFLSLYDASKGVKLHLSAYSDSVSRLATYYFNRNVGFEQYSLLGKLGVSYNAKGYVLGLTVLAPKVYLRGKGNYNYKEEYSSTEFINEPDRKTSNSQSGIKTNHKSPWAVGVGLTIPIRQNRIHLSSEWFSAVPKYTIMNISDHISQSSGDTIRLRVVDEFESVINIGLGLEYYINEKISGYLSASTDFSAVTSNLSRFLENTSEVNNSTFVADFYHFGGGVVFHFKGADITLGATYTGAKQDFARPVNFPEEAGDEIFSAEDKAELEWDRARIVFSFSVPFLKDYQKKVEEKLGF
jgi:hypothetical protein